MQGKAKQKKRFSIMYLQVAMQQSALRKSCKLLYSMW